MPHPEHKNIGAVEIRVIEECAELQHILSKCIRFGWDNWHPDDINKTTNRTLVKREISDLLAVIEKLEFAFGLKEAK